METQASQLGARLQKSSARIAALQTEQKALQNRLGILHQLSVFQSFRDLDWTPLMVEIERLEAERRELEQGSDILRTLERQLADLEKLLAAPSRGCQGKRIPAAGSTAERGVRRTDAND